VRDNTTYGATIVLGQKKPGNLMIT